MVSKVGGALGEELPHWSISQAGLVALGPSFTHFEHCVLVLLSSLKAILEGITITGLNPHVMGPSVGTVTEPAPCRNWGRVSKTNPHFPAGVLGSTLMPTRVKQAALPAGHPGS